MQVMFGLRRRFATFCDFALVSNAISPSRKPYHIATRWMLPSALIDASDIVCLPRRNSAISSSVIWILSRCLTPLPISAAAPPAGSVDRHHGIHRESDSITQAGFSLPSISMVMSTLVWMPPPLTSVTSIISAPARMRLPTSTGGEKRTLSTP